MPIGTPNAIAGVILNFSNAPDNSLYPTSGIEAAQFWGDVVDVLGSSVIPASTTHGAAKAAFIATLSPVSFSPSNGLQLLKSAFVTYAGLLATGMVASGYTGVPPPVPPLLESVLVAPVGDSSTVYALSSLLAIWMKTGTAVQIAPPNPVIVWI